MPDPEITAEKLARLKLIKELLAVHADGPLNADLDMARKVVFRDMAMCLAFLATARSQLDAVKGLMPQTVCDQFGIDLMIALTEAGLKALGGHLDDQVKKEKK